jgi:hypothetical protein
VIGPCTPYFSGTELAEAPGYCAPNPEPEGWSGVLDSIAERASEVMYVLTGRQFPGSCTTTRRPVRRGPCWPLRGPFDLLASGGRPDDDIPLWYSPRDIEVRIDGELFTDWVLVDGWKLRRTDGNRWPASNDLSLDASEPGTFEITWAFGPPTPGIVVAGALELGVQFEQEIVGDARCKLPPGSTSLARQGQTVQIDRDIERVRQAGPAIQSIMVATAAFNPSNARTPPDVWSPDHVWELEAVSKPAASGS